MRVVHDPAGEARVLAADVEYAEGVLEQSKGLMFRSSVPEGYALVFPLEDEDSWLERRIPGLGGPARPFIHMLFVRTPLDVLWILDGEVQQVKTLAPWRGVGRARADTVVEMAAGAADGVGVGDRVIVEGSGADATNDATATDAADPTD